MSIQLYEDYELHKVKLANRRFSQSCICSPCIFYNKNYNELKFENQDSCDLPIDHEVFCSSEVGFTWVYRKKLSKILNEL